jgi:hypothetical protein
MADHATVQKGIKPMGINVGGLDRAARAIIGLVLVGFAVYDGGGVTRWLALPGAILVATAIFRFCPAYWLFGVKTCTRS